MLVAAERRIYDESVLETVSWRKKRTKQTRVCSKTVVSFVVAIVFCLSFGLYYTSLSASIAQKGYELEKLNQEIASLQSANERLGYSVARMSSLDRVEQVAVQKLGMNEPDYNNAVRVAVSLPTVEETGMALAENTGQEGAQQEEVAANSLFSVLTNLFHLNTAEASAETIPN